MSTRLWMVLTLALTMAPAKSLTFEYESPVFAVAATDIFRTASDCVPRPTAEKLAELRAAAQTQDGGAILNSALSGMGQGADCSAAVLAATCLDEGDSVCAAKARMWLRLQTYLRP